MRDVRRNDPCPCGSGLKYKKCCLGREEPPPTRPSDEFFADVRAEMRGQHFSSLEEANVFLADFVQKRNSAPRDEFDGLSSEQMYRMLHFPFDSPDVVLFPSPLAEQPSAPVVTLFQLLAEAIGENGLKPTATGNLPRKLLREAGLAYWGEDGYKKHTEFGDINTEPDFYDVHATRIIAELAGLVRKYRSKFILGRECRQLLREHQMAGIYPRLLRAFAERFNWGHRDRYPDLDLIQQSFVFTLYLLDRYGGEWRPNSFYEDAFLRAFPLVLNEVPPEPYSTPEKTVRDCYSWRCLRGFVQLMGLAEVELDPHDRLERHFRLRKLPLLSKAVEFRT